MKKQPECSWLDQLTLPDLSLLHPSLETPPGLSRKPHRLRSLLASGCALRFRGVFLSDTFPAYVKWPGCLLLDSIFAWRIFRCDFSLRFLLSELSRLPLLWIADSSLGQTVPVSTLGKKIFWFAIYRGGSLEVSRAKDNIKFESKKGEDLWGLCQDSHPQHFTMKTFKLWKYGTAKTHLPTT